MCAAVVAVGDCDTCSPPIEEERLREAADDREDELEGKPDGGVDD